MSRDRNAKAPARGLRAGAGGDGARGLFAKTSRLDFRGNHCPWKADFHLHIYDGTAECRYAHPPAGLKCLAIRIVRDGRTLIQETRTTSIYLELPPAGEPPNYVPVTPPGVGWVLFDHHDGFSTWVRPHFSAEVRL